MDQMRIWNSQVSFVEKPSWYQTDEYWHWRVYATDPSSYQVFMSPFDTACICLTWYTRNCRGGLISDVYRGVISWAKKLSKRDCGTWDVSTDLGKHQRMPNNLTEYLEKSTSTIGMKYSPKSTELHKKSIVRSTTFHNLTGPRCNTHAPKTVAHPARPPSGKSKGTGLAGLSFFISLFDAEASVSDTAWLLVSFSTGFFGSGEWDISKGEWKNQNGERDGFTANVKKHSDQVFLLPRSTFGGEWHRFAETLSIAWTFFELQMMRSLAELEKKHRFCSLFSECWSSRDTVASWG